MANGKKLMLSRDRWIAGVCGGIANHFGWDANIVRLVWLVLTICSLGFPGIIVYVILWIVMPSDNMVADFSDTGTNSKRLTRSRDRWIAGVCGGIASYFGWDNSIVRLVWLILTICSFGFPGITAYVVLWIVMPSDI